MDMLEKLKKHRMEVATRENVPLYVVCRNDTLTEIVERLPRTEKELLAIKGVGPKTISKIKEKVFELVDRFDKCNISVSRHSSSSSSSSPSPSPSPSLLASSSEPAILSELSDSSESVKSMKEKDSNDNDNDCEDSLDAEHLQQAFKEPEPTDIKEIKDIKIAKEETPKIEKKKIEIAAESNSNSKTGGEGEDSLIEGLARLSLDSFIADKLPFPSEFKGNRNELMHSVNEDGNIVYDNREYIPDEWNTFVSSLERKYPLLKSIQADHPEGRRPVLTKKIKTQCWDKLPQTNAYIESGLRTQFRCDYYGNLVSIDAKDGSLCCFDPDHVFPWARGGLTTNSNLLAVQFAANRWGKSDKFMATLNRRDMLRGLTPLQFKNVLAYATKGEVAGTGRNDRNYAIQRVIGWLNNTPRNEQTISNFQTRYGTDCAGESLYNFFVEREVSGHHILFVLYLSIHVPSRKLIN